MIATAAGTWAGRPTMNISGVRKLIEELVLFHGAFGEFAHQVAPGSPFTVFPLMHFGTREAAIDRLAFRYVDDGGARYEASGTWIHGLNGKPPLLYEVAVKIDMQKLFECGDWGSPTAVGTAYFLLEALRKSGADSHVIAGANAVHKRLWELTRSAERARSAEREYGYREIVGKAYKELDIESVKYVNKVEGESASYCFLSPPKWTSLQAIHSVPDACFCKAVKKMAAMVPERI